MTVTNIQHLDEQSTIVTFADHTAIGVDWTWFDEIRLISGPHNDHDGHQWGHFTHAVTASEPMIGRLDSVEGTIVRWFTWHPRQVTYDITTNPADKNDPTVAKFNTALQALFNDPVTIARYRRCVRTGLKHALSRDRGYLTSETAWLHASERDVANTARAVEDATETVANPTTDHGPVTVAETDGHQIEEITELHRGAVAVKFTDGHITTAIIGELGELVVGTGRVWKQPKNRRRATLPPKDQWPQGWFRTALRNPAGVPNHERRWICHNDGTIITCITRTSERDEDHNIERIHLTDPPTSGTWATRRHTVAICAALAHTDLRSVWNTTVAVNKLNQAQTALRQATAHLDALQEGLTQVRERIAANEAAFHALATDPDTNPIRHHG